MFYMENLKQTFRKNQTSRGGKRSRLQSDSQSTSLPCSHQSIGKKQVHGYERENFTAMDNWQPHFGYLVTSLTSFELQHCKACPHSGSDVDVPGNSNEVGEREMANVLNTYCWYWHFHFRDKEDTVLVSDLIRVWSGFGTSESSSSILSKMPHWGSD